MMPRLMLIRSLLVLLTTLTLPAVEVWLTENSKTVREGSPGVTLTLKRGDSVGSLDVILVPTAVAGPLAAITVSPQTVTFADKTDTATVTITAPDNSTIDGDRAIRISISPSSYTIGTHPDALVTVQDDEQQVDILGITAAQPIAEGDTNRVAITVRSSYVTPQDVSVPLTITSSLPGAIGNLYADMSGGTPIYQATIPANGHEKTVYFQSIRNLNVTGPRVATISVGIGGYLPGTNPSRTLTIADADVQIVLDALTATAEGATDKSLVVHRRSYGGTTPLSSGTLSVPITIAGPATLTQNPILFADGDSTRTVAITIPDNTSVGAATNATFTLSAASGHFLAVSPAAQSISIANDDVQLTTTTTTVAESGDPVLVTLDCPGRAADTVFKCNIGGDATIVADYELKFIYGSTETTISASGAWSSPPVPASSTPVQFRITPIEDNETESNQTVTLTLVADAAYDIQGQAATITISDGDLPTVVFSSGTATVDEGVNATITLTRDTTNIPLSVPLLSTSGTLTPATASFAVGASTATVTYLIPPDGNPLSILTATISMNDSSGAFTRGTVSTETLTIRNRDVAIASTNTTIAEGANSHPRATITCGQRSQATTVVLAISGTALAADIQSMTGTPDGGTPISLTRDSNQRVSLVIPAEATSAAIDVVIADDDDAEIAETLVLTVVDDPAYRRVTGQMQTTWTITDNDQAQVSLSPLSGQIIEGQNLLLTISRGGATAGDMSVPISCDHSSASFDPPSPVVIQNGKTSASILLKIANNSEVDNTERIATVLLGTGSFTLNPQAMQASFTVRDDEVPIGIRLTGSANLATLDEGASIKAFVTRPNLSVSTTVKLETSSTPSNRLSVQPSSVSFLPGETEKEVMLFTASNTTVDGVVSATCAPAVDSTYVTGSPGAITILIRDDDVTASIAGTNTAVAENGPGSLTATVTVSAHAEPLLLQVGIGGTAAFEPSSRDFSLAYTLNSTTQSISPATGADTFTVEIPANILTFTISATPTDDTLAEGPESIIVTILPGNAYAVTGNPTTLTLTDNEPMVAITPPTDTTPFTEGDTARSWKIASTVNAPTGGLAVDFSLASGGVAASEITVSGTGVTFDATQGRGTATIPAGSQEVSVSIAAPDDGVSEQAETITLALGAKAAYFIDPDKSQASLTVRDRRPVASIAAPTSPSSITEGGTGVAFTISLDQPVTATTGVTVNFKVATGANQAGSTELTITGAQVIYNALAGTGTILIPKDAQTATCTIVAVKDGANESDETATIELVDGSTYYVTTATAAKSASITVTDSKPKVTVTRIADALLGTTVRCFKLSLDSKALVDTVITSSWSVESAELPTSTTIRKDASDAFISIPGSLVADRNSNLRVSLETPTGSTYTLGTPSTADTTVRAHVDAVDQVFSTEPASVEVVAGSGSKWKYTTIMVLPSGLPSGRCHPTLVAVPGGADLPSWLSVKTLSAPTDTRHRAEITATPPADTTRGNYRFRLQIGLDLDNDADATPDPDENVIQDIILYVVATAGGAG